MTRQLTRIIRAHPQVSDQQRVTLSLKPRRRGRGTPIPPPRQAPWMHIISVNGGVAKVRLFDRERPTNKGKPRGVDRIIVLRYVGEHPPRSLKEWNYVRIAGRTKFEVAIPADAAPGTSVWLTAQWANAKGQPGPGCSPVNLHLGYAVPRFGRLAA